MDAFHCDEIDESAGLADDLIEIVTFDRHGAKIDEASAFTAEAATVAARALLDDAVDAGHDLADLTVVFQAPGRRPVVLGRDATVAAPERRQRVAA